MPGEGWSSFEFRMRQRRAARLMERAQQAIEDGRFEEAEAALVEAREIGKDAQDVDVLEAALATRRNPVLELPPDLPLSDTTVSVSSTNSPHRGWGLAAAAAVVLAGAGLAYARYWNAPAPVVTPTRASAPAVVPVGTLGAPTNDRIDRLNIVRETITARIATPRLGEDELPKLPPYPSPPIAAPAPEPDPVVMAVNRPVPEPPPSTPLEARPTLPVESQPGPAAPPPPVRAFIPDSSPMTALRPDAPPARVESSAPAARETAAPAEPAVRDETVVLSVLQRYEAAYSNLDAAAASAVWPAVDRGALARAFNGLASQRVSLGDCDISVNGPSARATCSGSATWRPKVGGGSHTENRRWNFELRKAGENWKIEKAVIR